MYLKTRSFDRLVHSCNSGRTQIVRGAVKGVFSKRIIKRATGGLSREFKGILRRHGSVGVAHRSASAGVDARLSSLVPTSGVSGLSRKRFINDIYSGFKRGVRRGVFRYRVIISGRQMTTRAGTCGPVPIVASFANTSNGSRVRRRVREGCCRVGRSIARVVRGRLLHVRGSPGLGRLLRATSSRWSLFGLLVVWVLWA